MRIWIRTTNSDRKSPFTGNFDHNIKLNLALDRLDRQTLGLSTKHVQRIRKLFCPYNYGKMHSRLEWKYTLRTKIAWNLLYHIKHDSKVEERISMRINTYKNVQLLSFKPQ